MLDRSSHATRHVVASALVVATLGPLLAACGGAPATRAVSAYVSAWNHQRWGAMAELLADPSSEVAAVHREIVTDLHLASWTVDAGPVTTNGTTASAPLIGHLAIATVGTVIARSTLRLTDLRGVWKVVWTPSTALARLSQGDRAALVLRWPRRAQIDGARGVGLTTTGTSVEVGLEGAYLKQVPAVRAALVGAGASAEVVDAAVAAAKAHPNQFELVMTVSRVRYEQLKARIYALPGTVFSSVVARRAITAGLEAHVVGSVGPITAQELGALGWPYDATSTVGQSGIEGADERRLAGTPGATIEVTAPSGAVLATVGSVAPRPGRAVHTTIDPTVQRAAEAALAGVAKQAALVAIDTRTGDVLASVSNPATSAYDVALDGEFPPGSTFKLVTSAALIAHGLGPGSPTSCPRIIDAGGRTFHNVEGEGSASTLAQAFAISCNTAFVGLAMSHLVADDLPKAARSLGIGASWSLGLDAFSGSVPTPSDVADLAASAIGQGRVLVSPLAMATAAASIASGTVRAPKLVVGAADDTAATSAVDATAASDLRQMMASVVTAGTAANTGLPTGTYAKTGTAEYGSRNPLPTDAWLVGFRGHVAFAMVVVDGGEGGPTDGPVVGEFLRALGGAP